MTIRNVPSANAAWLERSRAAVWHPCTQMKQHETLPLVPIAHGEGAWLVDFEGRRYLDAVSSWWVNLFGHANPRINAALREQLGELEHVILAGFTHRPVVELSERLAALAPDCDPAAVRAVLESMDAVARGDAAGGPVAALDPSERFGWLTAPASTIVQPSPVHTGLTEDPRADLDRLLAQLVG